MTIIDDLINQESQVTSEVIQEKQEAFQFYASALLQSWATKTAELPTGLKSAVRARLNTMLKNSELKLNALDQLTLRQTGDVLLDSPENTVNWVVLLDINEFFDAYRSFEQFMNMFEHQVYVPEPVE